MTAKISCTKDCYAGIPFSYSTTQLQFDTAGGNSAVPANWFLNDGIQSCVSEPALPDGLTLSSSCTINGTPTYGSPATAYNITASSAVGSLTTQVILTCTNGGATPTTSLSFNWTTGLAVSAGLQPTTQSLSQCQIAPPLPVGTTLTQDCHVQGTPLKSQAFTTYTVRGQNSSGQQVTSLIGIAIGGADEGNLVFYYDPRKMNGTGPIFTTSYNTGPNEYQVTPVDLSNFNTPITINSASGSNQGVEAVTIGSGTPTDPYRNTPANGVLQSLVTGIAPELTFSNSSGTILAYVLGTAGNINFRLSNALVGYYWNVGYPLEYYSGVSVTPLQQSFGGSLDSPYLNSWYQYAVTYNTADNKARFYLNGQLRGLNNSLPGSVYQTAPSSFQIDLTNGDLGQVKAYSRTFSDSDILNACLAASGIYQSLRCDSLAASVEILTSGLYFVGQCLPVSWLTTDATQNPIPSVVPFSFGVSNSGSTNIIYSNSNCQTLLGSDPILSPASQSNGTLYVKPTQGGTYTLNVSSQTPNWQPNSSTLNVFTLPTSYLVTPAQTCGNPTIDVAVQDSQGAGTLLNGPVNISFTQTAGVSYPIASVPVNAGRGDAGAITAGFSATYTVTITPTGTTVNGQAPSYSTSVTTPATSANCSCGGG